MSAFKDIYDMAKDLNKLATKLKNQEMISLSLDIQANIFDLKEEMENIKDENKKLKEEIKAYKNPAIDESNIVYDKNGFLTLKSEGNHIPYCSACWRINRVLVPLAKYANWWQFKCSKCQSQIVVTDPSGGEFK